MENLYLELKNRIVEADSIVIFSHVNPDGDTLGSSLALNLMIENYFGKKADSVFVGTMPNLYSYLPEFYRFKNIEGIDKDKKYDLAIAVDVASKDRLVTATQVFNDAKYRINIDHHVTNIGYADLNIIDGDAACVGMILHRIFKEWDAPISLDIARCLYTSLMTDTGCFKYDNTSPDAFILAADLVGYGVMPYKEYRECYETKPQSMIQFQANIVANTIFYNQGKIAFSKITRNDMSKYNAEDDYTEGIVEVLRSSKNVEVAAILKETKDGYTKVSLRSKTLDLTPIVMDFGGGGHKFSAGCTIKKPIAIAFDKLLKRVQSEIE
ncbi:bifunctional oligoribonuclease/PAP phosphatase NrnA [bacterium]|nr:bifunctional oligoribonuclease/PAP phosphatase NrnA [bacterium]